MRKLSIILIILMMIFMVSCQKPQDTATPTLKPDEGEISLTEIPEVNETPATEMPEVRETPSSEEPATGMTGEAKPNTPVEGAELQQAQNKIALCESSIKNIATALEMYFADNETYPPSLDMLTDYMPSMPKCPAGGEYIYEPSETDGNRIKSYKIYCTGDKHKEAGVPENYPQFTPENGLTYPEGVSISRPDFEKEPDYMLSKCESNLKQIGTALEMCVIEREGYTYPPSLEEITPYLSPQKIPTCPAADKDTYSSSYTVNSEGNIFTVYCSGHHHKDANIPENYPQYNTQEGLKQKP